jgi:hypothetical protein
MIEPWGAEMGFRKKMTARHVAAFVAAIGVLVMSSGVAVMLSAGSAGADPNDNAKYFVCKYVGKPGVDETLQTGQNPISVSGNAIPETPVVVGSFFADAQGRSLVLVQDTGQDPEPSASDCPAPQGPQATSATVTFTEPTCDNDNQASFSGSGEGITFSSQGTPAPGATITVIATANEGFVLQGPSEFPHTFNAAETNCNAVTPPVVNPPVSPPQVSPPESQPAAEVATPAAESPTVVHAGLAGSTLDSQDGLALLVAGMIITIIAAGLGTVRPRGGTRQS